MKFQSNVRIPNPSPSRMTSARFRAFRGVGELRVASWSSSVSALSRVKSRSGDENSDRVRGEASAIMISAADWSRAVCALRGDGVDGVATEVKERRSGFRRGKVAWKRGWEEWRV